MEFENIIYGKFKDEPKIAQITLNRPERLNALSTNLLDEFYMAADEFDNDPEAVVLIVKGSGRAFSSGYDLGGGSSNKAEATEQIQPSIGRSRRGMNSSVNRYLNFWNIRKPTIAQIHGYCLSGGTELSAMCDLIVAAENSTLGHIAGRYQGTLRTNSLWPYTIGMRKTKEILFTGDFIDGKEAERIGMVNKAVPADELDDEVYDLARRIARVPLEILTLHKHSVNRWFETMGLHSVLRSSADFDAMGPFTGVMGELQKLVDEQGMQAALAFRDAPWRKYERKPAPKDE